MNLESPRRLFLLLTLIAGCSQAAPVVSNPAPEPETPSQEQPAVAESAEPKREKVLLFAAVSAGDVLDEIIAEFSEYNRDVEIERNYASSSALAQQIQSGADADLFLSANEKWADYVEKAELAAEQTLLLGNRLVIVVPVNSKLELKQPDDLTGATMTHIAVADPDSVPAGIYAKQALNKLTLWDAITPKLAVAEDVRQALTFVETGNAEAGVVYRTDAAASTKVRIAFDFDPALTEPIRYPLVLLKHGADRSPARRLYEFLQSGAARFHFQKHGFIVLGEGKQ